jgi:hypothetical protein
MNIRRYFKFHSSLVISLFILPILFSSSIAAGGFTTRLSVASDGSQGNEVSNIPTISADGRYVAFVSAASNLVSGDSNGYDDIFIYDRQSGQIKRVSVASDGSQSNNSSWYSSISAEGRYVAFSSLASNLVSGDTNGAEDVFVHDRQNGQTERISVASDGSEANNHSDYPSISADGRYVAFESRASNLVSGDTNGAEDVFIHDRQSGQTERVSVASDGTQGNNYWSIYPSISFDGRYVAFASNASNLVNGDTNGNVDVFVHDRQSGQTERVSVASDGTQGNGFSQTYYLSISSDGRFVAFYSDASNLVSEDTNGYVDIFVHDRKTGQTERISVASDGSQASDSSGPPSISADGRYVAFDSPANNLVSGDTNGEWDVFVHDRQNGQTMTVSVDSSGLQGNGFSDSPSISGDGRYLAFSSYASNLVSGDTNGVGDIFLHENAISSSRTISHIEISQAIQDEGDLVPLIVGKPSFVRVYVDCGENCNSLSNVTGVLRVYRQGVQLGTSLSPINSSITAYHEIWTDQRGNLMKTLNFTLPPEWTEGTITLEAEVSGELSSLNITFVEARPLKIEFVPVRDNGHEPSKTEIQNVLTLMRKVYPTDEINYIQLPTWEWHRPLYCNFYDTLKQINHCLSQNLLSQLTNLYKPEYGDFIFGWVPVETDLGVAGSSDPWPGGNGKAAFGVDYSETIRRNRVITHEIAHLLGRHHTNTGECLDVDSRTDWPYSTAKIQEWGLDGFGFGWLNQSNSSLRNPDSTYDYMSYCDKESESIWTSPFTYEQIFSDFMQLTKSQVAAQSISTMSSYFVIDGVAFTDDTAILEPVWTTSINKPENPPAGTTYCLEAQDASGNPIAQYCFNLSFIDQDTGEATRSASFKVNLPNPNGVVRIVLKKGTKELVSREISLNIPEVTLTYPNGGEIWKASGNYTITWNNNDLDGDTLTSNVYFSPDGKNWLPLGTNIKDTHLTIDASELPGSINASVRVVVSDGMNTSTDETDATFAIGSKVPQVTIFSPEENGNIASGSPILLEGTSYDLEDGILSDVFLNWSSSIDGSLGVGSSILVYLSPGLHTLTLTTSDSDNNVSSSNISISVIPCYELTLNHLGQGSDPTATPSHSNVCSDGKYVEGENISLRGATPNVGWQISGWVGTNNNASTSDSNTLLMPAGDHIAVVFYSDNASIYSIFMPQVIR